MAQDYPVTRLQAAKWLRAAKENLSITIPNPPNGKPIEVLAWADRYGSCNLSKKRILVCVGTSCQRVRLNWKQALGLLRRNYVRSYMDTV